MSQTEERPSPIQLDEMQEAYERDVMPGLQQQAADALLLQCLTVAERNALGQMSNAATLRRIQEAINKVIKDWKKEMSKVGEYDDMRIFVHAQFKSQGTVDLRASYEVARMTEGKGSIKLLMPDAPIRKFAPRVQS